MSTYRKIHGRSIQAVTTDPSESVAEGQVWYNSNSDTFKSVVSSSAWSSSGAILTARYSTSGAGTQTAGLIMGGNIGPSDTRTTVVEEYNGSGFSAGGALPTATRSGGSAGTQTASFYAGGYTGTDVSSAYTYDGSSWTSIPSLGTARRSLNPAAAGTTTASIVCGGYGGSPEGAMDQVEEYNGSSWSEQNDLPAARANVAACGTQTALIIANGGPSAVNLSFLYDGTNWTAAPNTNATLTGRHGAGTQTDAIVAGGRPPSSNVTENYDGTSWTTNSATLGTARYEGAPATSGTSSEWMIAGGYSTAISTATEEYNKSANVITAGAFASSGSLNTARSQIAGFGATTDASIGAGGYQYGPNTYTNVAEEYDGSTFTATPNMPVTLGFRNAGGTVTAGVVFGGHDGTSPANTSLWNGSSYSNGPNIVDPGYGTMGNGSQTALFMCGSSEPARPTTLTEEYDGSSWSSVPATLNTGGGNGMGVGSQTAGLAIGRGSPNPTENLMEEYNGSTWTVGHTLVTAMSRSSAQGGSTPQDNTMVAGGNATPNTTSLIYNGTSWVTGPSLATGRGSSNGMGAGNSASSMLVAGGNSPSTSASEKFTGETTALNVKTLTQG